MLDKIYRRTVRPDEDGVFRAGYVVSEYYCEQPLRYIRAARIIEADIKKLFEYVDPSEGNLNAFSFKILELLSRTCFEVEANLKGILRANGCNKTNLSMTDYCRVEQSHFLSFYTVAFMEWTGRPKEFVPFEAWKNGGKLDWYRDYNDVKHDSRQNFDKANFGNLCKSFTGLVALLSSQFWNEDTVSEDTLLAGGGPKRLHMFNSSVVSSVKFKFGHEFDVSERYKRVPARDLSNESFIDFPYA